MYLLWKTGRCNEAMFFQSQGPIQMRLMGEFVPVKQNFVLKTGMAEFRLCDTRLDTEHHSTEYYMEYNINHPKLAFNLLSTLELTLTTPARPY
ncbi:hypothetical protein M8J77_004067 [Diaphorina citri]|nr:hypothetical protein M8J77_004067 [Diaphorina citri]